MNSLSRKWHCGHAKPAYVPTSRGFDTFFGLLGGGFHHGRKKCPMNTSTSDLYNGTLNLGNDERYERGHTRNGSVCRRSV